MWRCIKNCVAEHLGEIGALAMVGVVAALVLLATGTLATGGAAAGLAAGLFAGVEAIGAAYIAGSAAFITAVISGLVGCIVACLTGVHN